MRQAAASWSGASASCANPACSFAAHEAREFEGYCCRKCRWAHEAGHGGVDHGPYCKRQVPAGPLTELPEQPQAAPPPPAARPSAGPCALEAVASNGREAIRGYASSAVAKPDRAIHVDGASLGISFAGGPAGATLAAARAPASLIRAGAHAASPLQAFSGCWHAGDGAEYWVAGQTLTSPDGSMQKLTVEGEDACSRVSGVTTHVGCLSGDNASILWSDGTVWTRGEELEPAAAVASAFHGGEPWTASKANGSWVTSAPEDADVPPAVRYGDKDAALQAAGLWEVLETATAEAGWNDPAERRLAPFAAASEPLPHATEECEADSWEAGSLRRDPVLCEWLTFADFADRYAVDSGTAQLKRYWRACCAEERRWDLDWEPITWIEFRRKHLPAVPKTSQALGELRRRWRLLHWAHDDQAEGEVSAAEACAFWEQEVA